MPTSATITSLPFGHMPDGRVVTSFTLSAEEGLRFSVTNYGGAITRLLAPDRNGEMADVVLGYETLEKYLKGRGHFGALTGRFANRIAGGRFTLDGTEYQLPTNNGANHLHGGPAGFDKQLWDADVVRGGAKTALKLSRLSPDGEQGYPGSLHVDVTYSLEGADTLRIDYHATCDRPTPLNLTNHSYFNLAGHGAGDIGGHELQIFASRFTPVDEALIPTGKILPVAGTPFDFTKPRLIGERIDADDEQIKRAGGYDQNFVIEAVAESKPAPPVGRGRATPFPADDRPIPAATVYEPHSGRVLEVSTTEPGMQFYSGNFLNGTEIGKGGAVYRKRNGFCLETQHFPDSPNQPTFPNCILRPLAVFKSTTLYRFTVRK